MHSISAIVGLALLPVASKALSLKPVWAVPSFDVTFCPLTPAQPCPQFRVEFIVNRGNGPYTPTGGNDTVCRAVQPTGEIIADWQTCEDAELQWKWVDYDPIASSMSMWPRDVDGYAHIALRQLSSNKPTSTTASSQQATIFTAKFRFRETSEAGGRPDAIIGCAVYNPSWPVRCSMNDLVIFGDNPPKPVVLNVTSSIDVT